jgi:hypothetical protein
VYPSHHYSNAALSEQHQLLLKGAPGSCASRLASGFSATAIWATTCKHGEGQVRAHGGEPTLTTLGTGDSLAEMSALDPEARQITHITETDDFRRLCGQAEQPRNRMKRTDTLHERER